MKEGHVAPLAKLKAIHPKTEPALVENVVDAKLRPYFETLLRHVPAGWLYAGFKLIRREEESAVAGPAEEAAESDRQPEETIAEDISASRDEEAVGVAPVAAQSHIAEEAEEGKAEPLLHWFFFPLASEPGTKQPSNLIAWEATSKSGRATYFFRLVPPEQSDQLQDAAKAPGLIEEAIAQLNDAIVVLNFRRKPIYLSDDSLEMQPRYRRYAIACRKLPELRRLRASFLGRALHTSPEAWEEQLEEFLAKAQII